MSSQWAGEEADRWVEVETFCEVSEWTSGCSGKVMEQLGEPS